MSKKKAIWSRLKDYKCPFCKGDMQKDEITNGYACTKCSFFMRKEKFDAEISRLLNPPKRISHIREEEDNQNALSSL